MLVSYTMYLFSAYIAASTGVYVLGHPRRIKVSSAKHESDKKIFLKGSFARVVAHSVQIINFILNAVPKMSRLTVPQQSMKTIYHEAVSRAFDSEKQAFITTGSPHSRAMYLRNFAWFYPSVLSSHSVISESDGNHRSILLQRSLQFSLEALKSEVCPTTLIPITRKYTAGVNYFAAPSDSLLGVFMGLRQLTEAQEYNSGSLALEDETQNNGWLLLSEYREVLKKTLQEFAGTLTRQRFNNQEILLCDWEKARSTATDTRMERCRFVTNANVWTTFYLAKELKLLTDTEIQSMLGRTLKAYKLELLSVFGQKGCIVDSLLGEATAAPEERVTLDFIHVHNGFWDLSSEYELQLLVPTIDIVLDSSAFRDNPDNLFFISIHRSKQSLIHRLITPSYHSRTIWNSFNVEFAYTLLEVSKRTGIIRYETEARNILQSIYKAVIRNGNYYELSNANGKMYRTWLYKSAVADSWFSHFATVWYSALGTKIDT